MPNVPPLSTEQRFQNAAWGMQDQIVMMAVPAGVSPALRGVALVNAGTLNIAGDYHCLIPLTGMVSTLEVHLEGVITGTITSDLNTTYFITDVTDPATYTVKQGASNDGVLSDGTLQTSSIATLTGEQYAWLKITVATSSSVIFTQAEYNGV